MKLYIVRKKFKFTLKKNELLEYIHAYSFSGQILIKREENILVEVVLFKNKKTYAWI